MRDLNNDRKGFTLIEIIVVLGILSLSMSILIPYYRDFSTKRAVEYWREMILSDLNRCKTNTINDERCWGIEITGESSYKYVVCEDLTLNWKEPDKKIQRNMKDFSSITFFLFSELTVSENIIKIGSRLFFSPGGEVGQTMNSQWSDVTFHINIMPIQNPAELEIQSGKYKKQIIFDKNGNFQGK